MCVCRSCCAFCCHIVSDIHIKINVMPIFCIYVYGLARFSLDALIWIDLLFSFIVNGLCNYCMNAVQRWHIYVCMMAIWAWRKRNHLYFGNCLLYWFSLCLFCYCGHSNRYCNWTTFIASIFMWYILSNCVEI